MIIYLHGFNSDGNGSTAKKLKEYYRYILTPSYDYINPSYAYSKLNRILLEQFKKDSDITLVGTSLGGFWANYFAQKYDLKCVLINPSLNPSQSIKKYIGENKNYSTGEVRTLTIENANNYKKFEVPLNKSTFRITMLSENDEIIDSKITAKLLKETKIYFNKKEGHRIKNISTLIPIIDEARNSYVDTIIFDTPDKVLRESIINALPDDLFKKRKYVDEVWDILQSSYEKIGGIHGSGFNSKDDMIKNIPFWKLVKRHGKIVTVAMYKDKNGRKRVAMGTDGSIEGKKGFIMIAAEDLKQNRAYVEVSGPSLNAQVKMIEDIKNHAIPYDVVEEILWPDHIKTPPLDDAEIIKHPQLKQFFYQRKIVGEWHTKIMLGRTKNYFN